MHNLTHCSLPLIPRIHFKYCITCVTVVDWPKAEECRNWAGNVLNGAVQSFKFFRQGLWQSCKLWKNIPKTKLDWYLKPTCQHLIFHYYYRRVSGGWLRSPMGLTMTSVGSEGVKGEASMQCQSGLLGGSHGINGDFWKAVHLIYRAHGEQGGPGVNGVKWDV